MFLLFGTKKKVRPVDGGKRIRERCPSCGHDAQFVECEVTSSLDIYFIDVMEDKKRVWVCTLCQEQFSVEERDRTPEKSEASRRPERAVERVPEPRAVPSPRPGPIPSAGERKAMARSSEIEDRLAALKRKMGPK